MRVADVDPHLLRAAGAALGLVFGLVATKVADGLPRRYGVLHLVTGARRSRRNASLLVLSTLSAAGIAHVLTAAPGEPLYVTAVALVTNAIVTTSVLAAAAIDLEHMILPNELTLGPAVLCLITSPLRSVQLFGSIAGAAVALATIYLPLVFYKRLRGQSGMGLGDAKLALMAGAWHGPIGALFVVFLGALQSVLAAVVMRALGLTYEVPESVKAELRELRACAAQGDEEAKSALAEDPMAADEREGTLGMRLPLGPFLALGCVEALFLEDHLVRWLGL